MRVWGMRTGISITLKPADRRRLKAVARDRNTPHKHVWRAEIVLLSADGVGTNEIMRRTGKSKTCVWRWQERFMEAGYDSLLHDKTRPSRIPPLASGVTERVVTLTQTAPPTEATHWTSAMMAKVVGISASSVQRIWRAHGLQPHRVKQNSPPTRTSSTSCATSSVSMSIRPLMPSSSRSMKRARSRRSTAPSPACQ
jgi:transposase